MIIICTIIQLAMHWPSYNIPTLIPTIICWITGCITILLPIFLCKKPKQHPSISMSNHPRQSSQPEPLEESKITETTSATPEGPKKEEAEKIKKKKKTAANANEKDKAQAAADQVERKATHNKNTKKPHKDMSIITEVPSDEISASVSVKENNPHRMPGTKLKVVDGKVINQNEKKSFDKDDTSLSVPLLSYVNRYEVETRHAAIEDEKRARKKGTYPSNYNQPQSIKRARTVGKSIKLGAGSTRDITENDDTHNQLSDITFEEAK